MPARDLCAALDRRRNKCCLPHETDSRWCERHNRERVKLYFCYKKDHRTLESFPEDTICMDPNKIRLGTAAEVKKWNEAIRTKCALLNRCIDARASFSDRFFGNDMDFGHKTFHERLISHRKDLESCLVAVEGRAYELMLAAQNALWVLEASATPNPCPEPTKEPGRPQKRPSHDLEEEVSDDDDEDPLETFYRDKIAKLRLFIKGFLAFRSEPLRSKWYAERREILWSYVRRIVLQHTSLMLLAQPFDSVEAFLDSDLDVASLKMLCESMEENMAPLLDAVEDVLRRKKEGNRVRILGGYVYQTSGGDFEHLLKAWYHMFALGNHCLSCVRRLTCKTVDQMIEMDKYYASTLAERRGKEVYFREQSEMSTMRLCGVTASVPDEMMKVEANPPQIYKSKSGASAHWEEKQDLNIFSLALSSNDPHSETLLQKCLEAPGFAVMWRKGPDGPMNEPPGGLCFSRRRQANAMVRLKYAKWEEIVFRPAVLEECEYTIYTEPPTHLKDCYQLIISDTLSDTRSPLDFVRSIVGLCYEVYAPGAGTLTELFARLVERYGYVSEEFVMDRFRDFGGKDFWVNDKFEGEGEAWEALWGKHE